MPIKVQSNLPAIKVLESENIFVMPNEVALRQDIRPLKNSYSESDADKNRNRNPSF